MLAAVACVLEASARKPGNVHRFADFDDATYVDFMLSALAIGPALDSARASGVGRAVLSAVEATRGLVASNTNLGMVLLLAPLAAVNPGEPLDAGVRRVLDATTLDDARLVYRAIRLANPGGLGSAPEEDVAGAPSVSLLDAMRLAADRDAVARQYALGYADVFGLTLPALRAALDAGHGLETAVIASFLETLAKMPDTLIARKRGPAAASWVSREARRLLDLGWPLGGGSADALDAFDRSLRSADHALNPGASADLVSAALFAALRDGTIAFPLAQGFRPPTGVSGALRTPGRPLNPTSADKESRPLAVPGSNASFKVRVNKDYLVFCSGHFITYQGDQCERLHGHNYRVEVEVEGPLDENHYVFDFIALKDLTRKITDELDHRMLLPTTNALIAIADDGPDNWRVGYKDRYWSFPRDECVLLPIANTTAELLADYIGIRLRETFVAAGIPVPAVMRVEVEESFGQAAEVEWRKDGPAT